HWTAEARYYLSRQLGVPESVFESLDKYKNVVHDRFRIPEKAAEDFHKQVEDMKEDFADLWERFGAFALDKIKLFRDFWDETYGKIDKEQKEKTHPENQEFYRQHPALGFMLGITPDKPSDAEKQVEPGGQWWRALPGPLREYFQRQNWMGDDDKLP